LNEDALAQCLAEMKKPRVEVHYGNVFAKGKTSKVARVTARVFVTLSSSAAVTGVGIV
jgi:hypothetical protein